MKRISDIIFLTGFFYPILHIPTPITSAAMGALITVKAGVINIGLEGTMLFAALSGIIFSAYSQSVSVGFLVTVVTGVPIATLMSYVALVLKSHITLTGIAINMFSSGCIVLVLYLICKDKGISSSLASKVLPTIHIPVIQNIPALGDIISGHNMLTCVAFLAVAFTYILLNKTAVGLRIRAIGESKQTALSVGTKPVKYQFIAMIISGVLAGMGGTYMSMGYVSWFSRGMIAGRGFIALAAQQLGQRTATGTLGATLTFGTADPLINNLQAMQMPSEVVQSIPYITTILGLVVFSAAKQQKEINRMKKI